MFKFDFDIEEEDNEFITPEPLHPLKEDLSGVKDVEQQPFSEITLAQLLDALPPLISYSPLFIPLSSGAHLALARRDLFDARFQLISESGEINEGDRIGEGNPKTDNRGGIGLQSSSALGFLDAPSDILPGIYEGGLKTWECSLDLVDALNTLRDSWTDVRGKRVLEIGCGTAIPSLYLLHELFASIPPPNMNFAAATQIHLQDYNASVLELVTVPNIILAWYMSPASEAYRSLEGPDSAATFDPSSPGELPLSSALKSAFLDSLNSHGLALRFFAGSWNTFDLNQTGGKYDLVLSSETIYATQSLEALIGLMEGACGCGRERPVSEIPLDELASSRLSLNPTTTPQQYICLVAAKVLYFGVGGGISEFVRVAEKSGHERGKVETILERKGGVERKVMRIKWEK